jgi:hypothetical protein
MRDTATSIKVVDVPNPVVVVGAREYDIHDDVLHAYRRLIGVLALDDRHAHRSEQRRPTARGRHQPRRRNRLQSSRHARRGEVHQVATMPRSIQDILDPAEELAERFENFDPDHAEQDDGKVLNLGPDRSGNLLEVVTVRRDDATEIVIHAMKMRRMYEPLLREKGGTHD